MHLHTELCLLDCHVTSDRNLTGWRSCD